VRRVLLSIVATALLGAGGPALAQPKQLTVQASVARDLARMIQASGFECPEVRAVYQIGADNKGNIMRIVCGVVGGPAIDSPSFRMHANPAGAGKITRWEQ
jgi:hypothetical protein